MADGRQESSCLRLETKILSQSTKFNNIVLAIGYHIAMRQRPLFS